MPLAYEIFYAMCKQGFMCVLPEASANSFRSRFSMNLGFFGKSNLKLFVGVSGLDCSDQASAFYFSDVR